MLVGTQLWGRNCSREVSQLSFWLTPSQGREAILNESPSVPLVASNDHSLRWLQGGVPAQEGRSCIMAAGQGQVLCPDPCP